MKKLGFLIISVVVLLSVVGCDAGNPAYVNDSPPLNMQLTGINTVENGLFVVSEPYLIAMAEGNITGHSPWNIIGFNGAVGTSSEDVWSVSSAYVYPVAEQGMAVVSTSAADAAAGTGIQKVHITYLDDAYVEHDETVTLDGLTPVNMVAIDVFRVQDMRANTVGTGGSAAGAINLTNLAGTTTYCQIPAGFTVDRCALFTVPAGKSLFVSDFFAGVGGLNAVNLARLTLRGTYDEEHNVLLPPGFFMPQSEIGAPNGTVDRNLPLPIYFPQKTDIKVSAYTDVGSANVQVALRGWLE